MNTRPPNRIRKHVNPLADQKIHAFEGFADGKPVLVDLGAYRGEFIKTLLEVHPNKYNAVVCEIRKPYAHYLTELFSEQSASVKVFDGDSSKNLKNILLPMIKKGISIERIFINFPDPWLKEKHKKRRVVTANFIQDCKTWIQPTTEFIFQTDQQPVFEDTVALLDEQNIPYQRFYESYKGIKTRWEELKTEQGSEVYRISFFIT